jgi:glutaredoxin 3
MIEIWGKDGCGYCEAAKKLCETRNLPYCYYKLGLEFTREELFETFPTAKTYPQIKVSGIAVGGFDGFCQYLEDTGYNGTGITL